MIASFVATVVRAEWVLMALIQFVFMSDLAVQQKLMRHADIRTTMNVYGDVVTNEMQEAHSKVVDLALDGAQC
jgi:integrase